MTTTVPVHLDECLDRIVAYVNGIKDNLIPNFILSSNYGPYEQFLQKLLGIYRSISILASAFIVVNFHIIIYL